MGPLLLALGQRVHAIRIVACSLDTAPDEHGALYPGVPSSFFLPDGRVGDVPPERVESWRRENHARLLEEMGIDVLETDESIGFRPDSEAYPGIPDSFFLPDGRVGAVPPEEVEAWRRENLPPWMLEDYPPGEELPVAPLADPSNLPDGLNVTVAELRAIQAAERGAKRTARVAALLAAGLSKEEARRVLKRQPLLGKMAPETLVARLAALAAALPPAVVTKARRHISPGPNPTHPNP